VTRITLIAGEARHSPRPRTDISLAP
jgi:hypothetical protein